MLSGERKKFGLKPARQHSMLHGLSNLVVVYETGAPQYCYIGLTEELVQAVGRVLPRGVSSFDPAYLMVVFDRIKAVWRVVARYVEEEAQHILWATAEKPLWVKVIKNVTRNNNHGTPQNKNRPRSARTSRTAA